MGALLGAVGLLVAAAFCWQWHHYRRFQEVRPGVLYRMGLPSQWGFRQIVRQYHIRTVVCLHEAAEPRLRAGWFWDWGEPSGPLESQVAQQLGVRFLHWPLPQEGPWPWPKPEYLDQFFRLMDDPENWPVLIHCWAGKHRTGTLVALFRLEYEGWSVSEALKEMYSFDFKMPFALQELNLRTYVRRPRPTASQWQTLQEAISPWLSQAPSDYEQFIRILRAEMGKPPVAAQLEEYLRLGKPFGVCLADWLLQDSDHSWLPVALEQAEKILFSAFQNSIPQDEAAIQQLATAAGLLADYGSAQTRSRLARLVSHQMQGSEITAPYRALVNGLSNRYRLSRLPYLKLLLEDQRLRPEPEANGTRYADTAVARIAAIVQEDFIGRRGHASRQDWDQAIQRAKQWFAEHPQATVFP
ncbi:MAG: tyrosine-protein phosphatase [Thermoguttaceae bacterium]|nr:tyrosine-protein phosphatase [Thermoguttaceae bacterium]MDW8038428.1 tyrosine-protein phosphatase [Thermoguttaceae bacterium]